MKNPKKKEKAAKLLRNTAEARHKIKGITLNQSGAEIDVKKLVHELEVHQIELEMQYQQLLEEIEETKKANQKYVELYHFLPLPYFILSTQGEVLEVNVLARNLLGKQKSILINSRFGFFISEESKPVFTAFFRKCF